MRRLMSLAITPNRSWCLLVACCLSFSLTGCTNDGGRLEAHDVTSTIARLPDGSVGRPLRVMLVPADGGTEDGTRADFEPLFNAITDHYGLHFEIRVGQSYNTVIEAMDNDLVDVAFFGAVSYQIARDRGAAELLAVEQRGGKSVYYSAIFHRADSGFTTLTDLKGKKVAFGDMHSTSSFSYPLAMLLTAGLDPARDLSSIYLAGSHANSLQALANGEVDAACASLDSYEKAVTAGKLDPKNVTSLRKSVPIPSPPLAMHVDLAPEIKTTLKNALRDIHEKPGVSADSIRGYGGKRVDLYNVDYPEEEFNAAMAPLAGITRELREAILRKAGER